MVTKGRFNRGIDSELNMKRLYNYYSKTCPNFYFNLKSKLKKYLVYRSNYQNWWHEKELLKKKCKLSTIDFNRKKTNFIEQAKLSRIVVCSYLSTTFLELMASNIPSILFTDFSKSAYNPETIKIFNKMRESKIFFDDYIKSANFINQNWETIEKWWWSNKVQKTRKLFLKNFSILNQNIAQDLQDLINRS